MFSCSKQHFLSTTFPHSKFPYSQVSSHNHTPSSNAKPKSPLPRSHQVWRRTRNRNDSGSSSPLISEKRIDSQSAKELVSNFEIPDEGTSKRTDGDEMEKPYYKKKSKAVQRRIQLDMCSRRGDVMGAIELYDSANEEGIAMTLYEYSVILYLCSSAAVGVVQPAKSGTCNNAGQVFDESSQASDGVIQVSEDVRNYALQKGLEIYESMRLRNVPMNEATLTAVARMAMSTGDGDMAFDMVKQMTQLGITPKLRSYVPALTAYCGSKDVEKAFSVENHMLEHGVSPEASELEALLRVSVEAGGKGDKVYYLLHNLRTSVRRVSPSTADIIVSWFSSNTASRVGKRKWSELHIKEAIENGGGGWHGKGWLGKGKWRVSYTTVGPDASCRCCGDKLATVDLDPAETENFAESVASIALKSDKDSRFVKFQKWLDHHGPFEVVVDGANVGLSCNKKFIVAKVNAVWDGLRKKFPSHKRPLIILYSRRMSGMTGRKHEALLKKWRNASALFTSPTGSNDDWYWLYAAIKFKSLIVTNDEMRDHSFQLLGNDFFPKWKERHQVRFCFDGTDPIFRMPPPYSVVIQESEKGHWHIPIASDQDEESDRTWLCITRANSSSEKQISVAHKREGSSVQTGKKQNPA